MIRTGLLAYAAIAAMCLAQGCSGSDDRSDGGVDEGAAETLDLLQPDIDRPDLDLSRRPWIDAIFPDKGPAASPTKVVLRGDNFAAGSAVFIDGGVDILDQVSVSPPVSIVFTMPKNLYGEDRSSTVSVMVLSDGLISNKVSFRYEANNP